MMLCTTFRTFATIPVGCSLQDVHRRSHVQHYIIGCTKQKKKYHVRNSGFNVQYHNKLQTKQLNFIQR